MRPSSLSRSWTRAASAAGCWVMGDGSWRTHRKRLKGLPTPIAHHLSPITRSEEHTSELQSPCNLVCRHLLEKTNNFYLPPHRRTAHTHTHGWITGAAPHRRLRPPQTSRVSRSHRGRVSLFFFFF